MGLSNLYENGNVWFEKAESITHAKWVSRNA